MSLLAGGSGAARLGTAFPVLPTVRDDFVAEARYVVVMDSGGGDRPRPGAGRASASRACRDRWWWTACRRLRPGSITFTAIDPPVVHGDVKPANVIRSETGRITLVDFGIASAGRERRRAGTRGYIAPEVAAEGRLTRAADVYGLAATAVALLTGRPPDGTRPPWEGIDPAEVGPLAARASAGVGDRPGPAASVGR